MSDGLRPSESCESVRLLKGLENYKTYYNQEQQCLEHFRFPQQFLRPTKKAFVSYITLDNLQPITLLGSKTHTLTAISSACKRRKIPCNFHLTRKIFASWLIKSGIDPTTVDMLQGRCPSSVLAQHYQAPDSQLRNRVLDAVDKLEKLM